MFNYVANFSRVHDKIDPVQHFHNIFNNFIGFLKTWTTVSQSFRGWVEARREGGWGVFFVMLVGVFLVRQKWLLLK